MLRSTSRGRGLRRSAVVVCSAAGLLASVIAAAGPVAAAGTTGAAFAWGDNDEGELGIGSAGTSSDVPVQSNLPAGVTAIAASAGFEDSLVVTSTGAVYAWGDNLSGQLGDGTTTTRELPVRVSLPSGVSARAVAGGYAHSLALTSTGAVYAWGDGTEGELGVGTSTSSDVPVLVNLPAGVTVTAVSAGEFDSFALSSTGAIYAWGYNADGQLGDGSTINSADPALVSLPSGVTATAVSAGIDHTLALTSTGAIYAWGDNANGELGDGTTTTSHVPVLVGLPAGVSAVAVAGGGLHSLAATTTGKVYAWGSNSFGQIGDSTTTERHAPVLASIPAGVTATAVSAGYYYSAALTSTRSAYAWGSNGYGQLGDGTTTNRNAPVAVSFPGVTAAAVVAGLFHALAVTPLAPVVTGVSPASGSTTGGSTVTVTGKGFTGATQVLFGSTVATGLVVVSDAKLTVTSPAHSTGEINVRVVTPAGKSAVVADDQFTYKVVPPKVTGVSPISGPTAGGTSIRVIGSGFTGATQVLFGSTVATHLVVVSDTQVTATSPAHGAGVMNVRVVTPVGKSGVVAGDEFTYLAPPKVSGVSPTSGSHTGGTHVTVTGTGFTGATQVLFGSTVATALVVVSDTQLTVTSPAHAAAVMNVRVITPNGKSSVVAADQFTYQ